MSEMTTTFPTTAVLTLATGTVMGDFSEAHKLRPAGVCRE